MRWLCFLLLAGCLAATANLLIGNAQPPTPSTAATKQPDAKDDDKKPVEKKSESEDEAILRRAGVPLEADALVQFFQKRCLAEKDRADIAKLIRQVGAADYRTREKATLDLVKRGPAVLEMLRAAPAGDTEVQSRLESSIRRIHEKEVNPGVRAIAVRVLAQRKPGSAETLLAYLPFADDERVIDEIRWQLIKHARKDGKPDPALAAALSDRAPPRRAGAAEALARVAGAEHQDALRKLLADADPSVRYHTARGLAFAKEPGAVPVLIDALTELPINAAWQAEDFLLRLAGATTPPTTPMGNDKEARARCKAAWQLWWKANAAKVDLAKLEDEPRLLGRTLIVLLDQGRVLELGPDQQLRFDIKGINYPLDAQAVGEDRVLLAEYHGRCITERNAQGDVVWQQPIMNPLVARRPGQQQHLRRHRQPVPRIRQEWPHRRFRRPLGAIQRRRS